MTADNKSAAQAAILNVHSDGGTNLSGGLFKGIDQHQQLSPPQQSEQPNVATGQSSADLMYPVLSQSFVAVVHVP